VTDDRSARAEAMLDKMFTPAWRNFGGKGDGPEPSQAARDFARLCTEHCYADSWSREGNLDFKLVGTDELEMHLRGALTLGHQPDDMIELFIQLLPYLGTPRLTHAMRCADEIFREHSQHAANDC